MEIKPLLHSITIYPVKSLDGIALQKAMITDGGCLLHDREYAMFDEEGKRINGKSNPLVHTLRSAVDFETETISFRHHLETTWHSFHLQKERTAVQSYLSDHFGIPVILLQDKTGRFLDIPDVSGATVLSTSTLQAVSEWYDMSLDETRKRFRATLEIEGVPAFWEDHLFSAVREIEFMVGDVKMLGMSPRARCVVPTRHPETAEVIHAFPKSFAAHRKESLPEWSDLNEYGHYYHLSVDCSFPATEIGKWIEVGSELRIIS
ncbi:MAG: hypothetical protein JWN78_1910 [Bacteroidota bacterium]|nr:hypothetical protein [Bacteroidota bacterium]